MESRGYRSPFWPIVLIGVGLIWLLANLGAIPQAGLFNILRLWPLLLIMVGLDILIGRRSPWLGAVLGILVVGAAILLLVAAPALGLPATPEVKNERFTAPLEGATSARIDLDFGSSPVEAYGLSDTEYLIDADIDYVGVMLFDVNGGAEKTVHLEENRSNLPWSFTLGQPMDWRIGLSPAVPLNLDINGGSGSNELDLSGLTLSALVADLGSGSSEIALPAGEETYTAEIQGGSGSIEIRIPQAGALRLHLDGGSGSVAIDVPDEAAVRFEVADSGSGSVSVPSGWDQVQENEDDEGVWESPGTANASRVIEILVVDVGSGSIRVR